MEISAKSGFTWVAHIIDAVRESRVGIPSIVVLLRLFIFFLTALSLLWIIFLLGFRQSAEQDRVGLSPCQFSPVGVGNTSWTHKFVSRDTRAAHDWCVGPFTTLIGRVTLIGVRPAEQVQHLTQRKEMSGCGVALLTRF